MKTLSNLAKQALSRLVVDDPEIDFRIKSGIEVNRKGFAEISLVDREGKEIEAAEITYRHLKHEYQFGCNAFMLEQFQDPERNAGYKEMFSDIFNLAVVPFYWDALEPEPGKYRFGKDSLNIYRRPPVDLVLEFCEEYNITSKGHCLVWQMAAPSWVPNNKAEMERCLEKRIQIIAERYASRISIWDVCNEALQWKPHVHSIALPDEHMEKAFKMAAKYFPESSQLIYNEGPWVSWNDFHGDYTPPYLLARHLLNSGLRVGGFGLQYHMAFYGDNFQQLADWSKQFSNQRILYAHMDIYGKLGLPLNVSEITIPSQDDALGDGERFQELVTEKLYRIWFSHPATEGIVWWNLVDNTAFVDPMDSNNNQGENRYLGGLLKSDLKPKRSYRVLKRLIKEEWHSSGTLNYQKGVANKFHGFYGDYELKIKTNLGEFTHNVSLSKKADNMYCIGC